jgi:hypothetical protein
MLATMVEQLVNKISSQACRRARLLGVGLALSGIIVSSVASAATVEVQTVSAPGDNEFMAYDDNSGEMLFTLYDSTPVTVTFSPPSTSGNVDFYFAKVDNKLPLDSISFRWEQTGLTVGTEPNVESAYSQNAPNGILDQVTTSKGAGFFEALLTYNPTLLENEAGFYMDLDFGTFDAANDITLTVQANPSPVPLPAAAWLFASAAGLTGLLGGSRRRQRAGV